MCGLVGAVSNRDVIPEMIQRLQKFACESCYQSGLVSLSGYGLISEQGMGKLVGLEQRRAATGLSGKLAVAHTQSGVPGEHKLHNSATQVSHGLISVTRIGDIINSSKLRKELCKNGYRFNSTNDSEVIAHRIHYHLTKEGSLARATRKAAGEMRGRFAFLVLGLPSPQKLIVAHGGYPLYVGMEHDENIVSSNPGIIGTYVRRLVQLQDGDVAEVSQNRVEITSRSGFRAVRPNRKVPVQQISRFTQRNLYLVKTA